MRRTLMGSLAVLLLGSSVTQAQALPTSQLPPFTAGMPTPVAPPNFSLDVGSPLSGCFDGGCKCAYQTWGGMEYLLWHYSNSPLRDPLVTTFPTPVAPAPPPPPPDPVLFGGNGYSSGWQSGYRLTLGTWLDSEQRFGVEGSGFYMVPQTPTNFAMKGSPGQVIAVPFNNVTPGGGSGGVNPNNLSPNGSGPSAFLISGGEFGALTGRVNVTSSTNLWGAELNGLFNFYRTKNIELNFLYGVRYTELQEDLYLNAEINNPFGASLRDATFSDHWGTRNQFYGGQLGLKGEWSQGMFFVSAFGKVALGENQETINIDGSFADPTPIFLNNYGMGKGGLLTQPSNIGQYSHSRFMVLPEGQIQVGLNLGRNARIFAGYDCLYMSSVVRPGNQIDHNINLSQMGVNASGNPNTLVGPASPGVPFQQSSFWAQGITFGLEFRY